jgi:hypothetical protein
VTAKTPLRMPLPEVNALIAQTLKEGEEEAYAASNAAAVEARNAAS